MALHPCAHCGRHVRHSETRCPFCEGALEAMSAELAPVPRVRRALLVAAVGLSTAASGCDRVREMLPWVREERERAAREESPPVEVEASARTAEQRAAAERLEREVLGRQQQARDNAASEGARYGAPPAPLFDEV